MITAFVTGKWQKDPNWDALTNSELKEKFNFIKMDPKKESIMECESIIESLLKIDEKGLFVRSGKGSRDICFYSKEGIIHLVHFDMGVSSFEDGVYDQIVLNQLAEIKKIASDMKLTTIVITGSFYYHIRGLKYLDFIALEDNGNISQFFGKPSIIAIRNFHEGEPGKMFKSTFCRQIDGKYNGVDLGTGKCAIGGSGVQCKVFIDDIETTKKNLLDLILLAKEKDVKLI